GSSTGSPTAASEPPAAPSPRPRWSTPGPPTTSSPGPAPNSDPTPRLGAHLFGVQVVQEVREQVLRRSPDVGRGSVALAGGGVPSRVQDSRAVKAVRMQGSSGRRRSG